MVVNLEMSPRIISYKMSPESGYFTVRQRNNNELLKAKQRASIKYLLSKAYNHRTPEELAEPFYSDHDDLDRLKPHIVHALANAELYCMALSYLYQDPNLHNLNHWGIIQALARKGIYVAEPSDCSLTETVLIQTTPLKMSAHMAVTEAVMSLFIKEAVSLECIQSATRRILCNEKDVTPSNDQEESLLNWVNACCIALKHQAEEDLANDLDSINKNVPCFTQIKEISDLSDGIGLAGVLAHYCPDELMWREIALGSPPSMADSLYNIQLVHRFCKESLNFNICHLSIEDIVYMHDSIKLNIISFLADLFNNLEVKTRSVVRLTGINKNNVIEVPDPACCSSKGVPVSFRSGNMSVKGQIPDLRPSLDHEPTRLRTDMHRIKSPNGFKRNNSIHDKKDKNEDYIVQRGKSIITLSSFNKEDQNTDTKSDERGETGESVSTTTSSSPSNVFEQMKSIPVAGRPSDSPVRRVHSYAGRRSRRNSVDDNASQLSLENLGGSSENLKLLGRNPDKEMRVHTGRKTPNNDRNSMMDNRNLEEMERRENSSVSSPGGGDKVCFADLRRQKARDQFSGINITYMQQEKEDFPKKNSPPGSDSIRSRTFQDSNISSSTNNTPAPITTSSSNENGNPEAMASQLNSVRLKLEQRRKRIEEEKKRMESVMAKQREKVGQEAFLRAVVKGNKKEEDDNNLKASGNSPNTNIKSNQNSSQTQRPISLKDLNDDLNAVQSKWCNEPQQSTQKTPDMESMDIESYSRSLHAMNDSLHDLQSDIQRLTQQQGHIQQIMHTSNKPSPHQVQQSNPMDPQPFYIAPPDQPSQRRTWGQPQPISFAHQAAIEPTAWQQQQPSPRRPQWGSPHMQPMQRSHMPHGHPVGYYGPQSSQYDPYSSPMRDQWGNPIHHPPPPLAHHQMYPNNSHQYDPQYNNNQYGYGPMQHQQRMQDGPTHPMYYDQYNNPGPAPSPYNNSNSNASPLAYMSSPSRTPFRLHDNKSTVNSSSNPSPSVSSPRVSSSFGNRGSSEIEVDSSPPQQVNRTLSRQSSRDSTASRSVNNDNTPRRVIHSSIPAPEEDDMAPQNVSFIEESSSANDEETETQDSKLSERLSNLNISSGSKTYRVSENSPSPTRQRPTISSTFKQNRRGSGSGSVNAGETSGPASLRSNSGANVLTEEEAEILSQMKTEKLKDDGNSGLGFLISFGDDAPKKPKPQLKQRRLSNKKANVASEMSSDGSNSSRKENVPPDLMICIDMNMGDDRMQCASPYKKMLQNGDSPSPNRSLDSQWHINTNAIDHAIIPNDSLPKFELDPEVELQPMILLRPESGSESDNSKSKGLIVGNVETDATEQDEMQRKKERIMMQSLKRKQQSEETRIKKEEQARLRKAEDASKEEEKVRKKDEERARREAILEQHRLKKEMERLEMENGRMPEPVSAKPVPKMRSKNVGGSKGSLTRRPRPKTIHVDGADAQSIMGVGSKRGSSSNISGSNLYRTESRSSVNHDTNPTLSLANMGKSKISNSRPSSRTASRRGSSNYSNDEGSLAILQSPGLPGPDWAFKRKLSSVSVEGSPRLSRIDRTMRSASQPRGKRDPSISSAYAGDDINRLNGRMRGESYRGSRDSLTSGMTYSAARRGSNASVYDDHDYYYGGSMRDLSGRQLGRTRKASSSSHIGPGSLPGYSRRSRVGGGDFDDGASDISSTASGFSAYGYRPGTRLYREPATKSNRPIILNAIEFVVFPGVVNAETRNRVLNVVDRCDCSHFLLLFRDQKCQFRGLYAFYPDTDEVYKIYGTGPKSVTDKMFEIYFKYNSGGKKFTKIHTKHLSVTIDAFTIHNSLWLGKKAKLPDKKDMALVI
uniref:Patronin n=1 Tax=Lepeophtheirus salmonis TaxID=72036 RepID=A0A0K2TD42_LEPSM